MTNAQKWSIVATIISCIIFIYLLSPILTPFFVGGLFAYLGDPLVNRLLKLRIPRLTAVVIVFALMILIVLLFLLWLIPLLEKQIIIFITKLPEWVAWVQTIALPWFQRHFDVTFDFDVNTIKAAIAEHWKEAGSVANGVWKTVSHSGKALLTTSINIILVPVVTFYLLRDWPLLVKKMRDLIPRRFVPSITEIVRECNEVIGAFFRGQLMVMLALGIIYSSGLAIIGLDLALLIGIVIAVLSIVPYLGSLVGLLTAVIAALIQFHDVMHLVYVLILFAVGHILENMVLAPLLIGDRIGLHPVAVIFAILAGGQLFGFLGILLALPVAAIVMVWARYFHNHYLDSDIYKK